MNRKRFVAAALLAGGGAWYTFDRRIRVSHDDMAYSAWTQWQVEGVSRTGHYLTAPAPLL